MTLNLVTPEKHITVQKNNTSYLKYDYDYGKTSYIPSPDQINQYYPIEEDIEKKYLIKKYLDYNYERIPRYSAEVEQVLIDLEQFEELSLKDLKVSCAICGHRDNRIYQSHLNEHNISLNEYKKYYGPTTMLAAVRNKMESLYSPNMYKWQEQLSDGNYIERKMNEWYKIDDVYADNPWYKLSHPLNLGEHLLGKKTFGCYTRNNYYSTFLSFDVDLGKESKDKTLELVNELTEYIPRENIHVTFSGKKGYHVELFFESVAKITDLEQFGKYFVYKIGCTLDQIEVVPTRKKKAIKLPLGWHRVTGDFCCLVDNETLYRLPNQYFNFLSITPIDPKVLDVIRADDLAKVKPKVKIYQVSPLPDHKEATDYCSKMFYNGLQKIRTRHNTTLRLAVWMRDEKGVDKAEAKKLLWDWTIKQYEAGMVQDNLTNVEKDLDRILQDVYDKNKYRLDNFKTNISITRREIEIVQKEIVNDYTKKLFVALLVSSKIYYTREGVFFIDQRTLAKMAGISRPTVRKYLPELIELGYVKVLREGSFKDRKATEYQMNISNDQDDDQKSVIILKLDTLEPDCTNILSRMLRTTL